MKLKISKRFVKDSNHITDQRILAKLRHVLLQAEQAQTLADIANLAELAGYPHFYRSKFDYRYRIGIYYQGEAIEFLRVGTREEFYKRFP
jgi:mRNA-degrading endonuclease RelE of RelBE toxin-antitoxin system